MSDETKVLEERVKALTERVASLEEGKAAQAGQLTSILVAIAELKQALKLYAGGVGLFVSMVGVAVKFL